MFLIVFPFLVKAFYIPSASMHSTLVEDDRILVDKLSYRFIEPRHKDIVVFNAPDEAMKTSGESADPTAGPTDYIKRLIGLPGDVIEVHAGIVKIGLPGHQRIETHTTLRRELPDPLLNPHHQHLKFFTDHISIYDGADYKNLTRQQLADTLNVSGEPVEIDPGYVSINGVKQNEPFTAEDPDYDLKFVGGQPLKRDASGIHSANTEIFRDPSYFDQVRSEKIPAGKVVVFGDNRNDSNDSSAWGELDRWRIIGKAFMIFFPVDRIRMLH
jgi:signal peptidase I